MNWNFKKAGMNCYVIRKKTGEYRILIWQKIADGKRKEISLWLPNDESFDFIVEQLYQIQLEVFGEKIKKLIEEKKDEDEVNN